LIQGQGIACRPITTRSASPGRTLFTSRYIKIRAQNDGSQASSGWIELKGVKAFSQ
jgi:hypothetical protein